MAEHIFSRPDRVIKHRHGPAERADLYVLTAIFNPVRFRSRWKLYQDWAKRMKQAPGVKLCVAEVALRKRSFVIGIDDPVNPDILLQLEMNDFIWSKEWMLNRLIEELPLDWQYLATIDADTAFAADDWANSIVQKLQEHPIVQPWTEADDLGPDNTTIAKHLSFVYSWQNNLPRPPATDCAYYYYPTSKRGSPHAYHPGYAWAYRKDAINDLGRLLDVGILGSSDNHMAWSLIGEGTRTVHPDITDGYRNRVLRWEKDALLYIKKDIGFVPGKLLHYFHGPKKSRNYRGRWKILIDNQYNPDTDIKPDWQGLPQIVVESPRQERFRDQTRDYFRARDEDSNAA